MDQDVEAIVAIVVADRARFARFVRSLSEDELARPAPGSSWIVKDFISHLATLDPIMASWFRAIAGRRAGTTGDGGFDIDAYNDAKVAERRDRPIAAILAEAERERAALLDVLSGLTAADLARTIHFGGDSKRPPSDLVFGRYLRGWARHDAIHTADMLKALPDRRADPDLVAWLAEPEVAATVGAYQQAMA